MELMRMRNEEWRIDGSAILRFYTSNTDDCCRISRDILDSAMDTVIARLRKQPDRHSKFLIPDSGIAHASDTGVPPSVSISTAMYTSMKRIPSLSYSCSKHENCPSACAWRMPCFSRCLKTAL